MITDVLKKSLAALLLSSFFALYLNASFVIRNDDILPQKTIGKIDEMGNELKEKTGVGVYLAVVNDKNGTDIRTFEKKLSENLEKPYVLLTLLLGSKKVDIVNTKDLNDKFDKEQVLSPFPWSGSILPLITSKSKDFKAAVEAAMLNGYADIVDQIANSYGIKLNSSIGSQNKITYNVVKIIFYGTFLLILLNFLYHKFFKKR